MKSVTSSISLTIISLTFMFWLILLIGSYHIMLHSVLLLIIACLLSSMQQNILLCICPIFYLAAIIL
jgi:hypothetical protein